MLPQMAMVPTATLLLLLFAAAASGLSSEKQLTLDAGGCQGVQWSRLGEKYGYTASLTSLNLPSGCSGDGVTISKLYVEDACVDRRDNNFEVKLEPEHVICAKARYPDANTCRQVMMYAPAGATVVASSLQAGTGQQAQLDSDNICYNTDRAFVFVSNNCSQPLDATLMLETSAYAGDTCVVVEGHALGAAGIAGIVIACVVVLAILSTAIKCLCCCL